MLEFTTNVWHVTQELGIWLLLGCAIAGIMHVFLPENFIRRHLGTPGLKNIVKAALLGVPLPLCSCGVIPAAIGLKKDGASDGASIGFLVSTPQTGVDSIAVSAAFLGLPFAIFKVVSAFVTGLFAGLMVQLSEPAAQPKAPPPKPDPTYQSFADRVAEAWHFALDELLAGFAVWVLVGILLSALITTVLPTNSLADTVWATGITGILLMLVISLPMYVCATGSVPIAAALVAAGMPTGAALVFLMAGPATNAATLGAILKEFGRRVTAIYVSVIAVGSILCGLLYEWVMGRLDTTGPVMHESHSIFHTVGGLVLAAFMIYIFYRKLHRRFFSPKDASGCSHCAESADSDRLKLTVSGMTCGGCAKRLEKALLAVEGVQSVSVHQPSGSVAVKGEASLDRKNIERAIKEAGFGVEGGA